jgi:hypothetical protein
MKRRNLLKGLAALIVSLALPRMSPAFDERELLRPFDPKVKGVRWQSWPMGTDRPEFYGTGSLTSNDRKEFSHFVAEIERHRCIYPDLEFEPII